MDFFVPNYPTEKVGGAILDNAEFAQISRGALKHLTEHESWKNKIESSLYIPFLKKSGAIWDTYFCIPFVTSHVIQIDWLQSEQKEKGLAIYSVTTNLPQ